MSVNRIIATILVLTPLCAPPVLPMQCWQCASVDGRNCPENAKMVDSGTHDACITWRLGNGTVILQNVVNFKDECTGTKIDFWTRFIDLYYQSTGGEVRCCDDDGCNNGAFNDDFYIRPTSSVATKNENIPGAPLIFGAVSNAPGSGGNNYAPRPTLPTQFPANLASMPNYAMFNNNGHFNGIGVAAGTQQLLATAGANAGSSHYSPQLQVYLPQSPVGNAGSIPQTLSQPSSSNIVGGGTLSQTVTSSTANLAALSGYPVSGVNNGNCQTYFPKKGDGEWMPNTLIPLSYDRASETNIGVFYTRFTSSNGNNDHVIVRLVGSNKSNATMYSFKLYRVGSVSLFVSKLTSNNAGTIQQIENRETSQNNAINITDDTYYSGFWFTIKDDEISLGEMGDELINPVLVWNDTKREGPRDVTYFALTTDQSQASFGVNCDVPNLHFEDTCVSDDDCEEYPNTVCSHVPVNAGLDPGTRKIPFEEWKDRDKLLKSCFCREGNVRIPQSKGCYDPIRQVVTLRDACFANYHCNDLPNTQCAFDKDIPLYNKSCQCIPGNKAFDRDPRTGLIEGCAPLTDADRATVLGCGSKIFCEDDFAWKPNDLFSMERDANLNVDYTVFYVKLASNVRNRNDIAVIRLLDEHKNPRKMLSIKFYRQNGKITLSESTRSTSFFFENERDSEKIAVDDLDVMTRMQLDYIGFWVQYRYEDGVGGTLCIGLNGAPFSSDYALLKWTDSSDSVIKRLSYVGFTGSPGSVVHYGMDCLLLDAPVGSSNSPFAQKAPQSVASENVVSSNFQAANFAAAGGGSYGSGGGSNLNTLNQASNANQFSNWQSLQNLQNLQHLQQLQAAQAFSSAHGGLDQASLSAVAQVSLLPSQNPWRRDIAADKKAEQEATSTTTTTTTTTTEAPAIIIEPVLRNEYLTKIKRLLPTQFEDFKEGELELATKVKSDKEKGKEEKGEKSEEPEYVSMDE